MKASGWGLTALAFLTAVTYMPGVIDPAATGRWAVLAVGIPLLLMAHTTKLPSPLRGAGIWYLAAITFLTLAVPAEADENGIYELTHLFILAGAFGLGAIIQDLRAAWRGFAIGVGVSAVIAVLQVSGFPMEHYGVVTTTPPYASGLFMNKNLLAEAGMVAMVASVMSGWWVLAAMSAVAVVLGGSKAVYLALVLVTIARLLLLRRMALVWTISGMSLLTGIIWLVLGDHTSLSHRLVFWDLVTSDFMVFGHGLGAFTTMYPKLMHAHSEYLQALYELGIMAAPLAFGLLLLLPIREPVMYPGTLVEKRVEYEHETERLVLFSILVVAAFSFPLHLPATGFAAALAAGRLVAGRRESRDRQHDRTVAFKTDRRRFYEAVYGAASADSGRNGRGLSARPAPAALPDRGEAAC